MKIKFSFWILFFSLLITGCNTMSEEREEWLIENAKKGDLKSRYIVAASKDATLFKSVNEETRENYMKSLLEQEYVPAMIYEANHSRNNVENKIKWLKKAADKGSGYAMYLLYQVYSKKEHQNDVLADAWLRKSAMTGYSLARDAVRGKDGVKVSWWCSVMETIQDDWNKTTGTSLTKLGVVVLRAATYSFAIGFAMLFSFDSTWWVGLLLLLGLLVFVGLFAVAYYYYEQYDMTLSNDGESSVSWLMLIYIVWGFSSCLISGISDEFACNVGRFWLAEGTFGFWSKLAIGLSWMVLMSTILAIRHCVVNTVANKRKIRLLLLLLINVFCFVMGAFLSFVAVLWVVFAISSSAFWSNVMQSTRDSYRPTYNDVIIGDGFLGRGARWLWGNRFEDRDGNVYKQTDYNEFEKENSWTNGGI